MSYEIDFLPVGDSNGDAICIRYGSPNSFFVHVVDGGFTDTGDIIIDHIERYYTTTNFINHMVLSHADNDHACGLIKVLERFEVRALWMNRPWLYAAEILDKFHGNYTEQGLVKYLKDSHPYLVELEQIATRKGTPVYEVFQGATIGQFTVLAPSRARYVALIPDFDKSPTSYETKSLVDSLLGTVKTAVDALKEGWNIETLDENPPETSASNESSVVQFGNIDGSRILLTADVGPEGLNEAADYASALGMLAPPAFAQVPHHGSRRNVTPSVLNRWLGSSVASDSVVRGIAYVSVGKDADIYPRKKVKNAFMRSWIPRSCNTWGIKSTLFGKLSFQKLERFNPGALRT